MKLPYTAGGLHASEAAKKAAKRIFLFSSVSLLCSCKESGEPRRGEGQRSEVVVQTAAVSAAITAPPAHSEGPKKPRLLCQSSSPAVGKSISSSKIDHLEASGTPSVGDRVPLGNRWTWINLWAAWCGPCKEEIPRLRSWEQKLNTAGSPVAIVFLSLDDDERQAIKFMESQPINGLRSTLWLREGHPWAAWLDALRLRSEIQLPVQLIVDPQGIVRCVIEGAVEDSDYSQIAALLRR